METEDITEISEEIARRFGMSDIFQNNPFYMDSSADDEEIETEEPDDIIIVHMDIRQPLHYLHKILKQKVGVNLDNYKFVLQDSQELEPHKNLVDQCVKGEGLVQINVQIQTIPRSINIVDVLKPTEAALAALALEEASKVQNKRNLQELGELKQNEQSNGKNLERPCPNWVPDSAFRREQQRLKIPDDPLLWTVPQVRYWFQWAMNQFQLTDAVVSDWNITGRALCAMTHEQFRKKIPSDPGNIFWTHIQLLKECKFVSVVHRDIELATQKSQRQQKPVTPAKRPSNVETIKPDREFKIMRKSGKTETTKFMDAYKIEQGEKFSIQNKSITRLQGSPSSSGNSQSRKLLNSSPSTGSNSSSSSSSNSNSNSSNNNSPGGGQMQLWQFLLELLTDRDHTNVIQWVGADGEFKLTNPEAVARLWGVRKNKPAMNYEKLSRALRYYYDGDMISKVSGKRFAYKFDCDLKLLIGYDAGELSALVSNGLQYKNSSGEKNSESENM